MSYTYLTGTSASLGRFGGSTSGIDTSGADLLVVAIGFYGGATATLSDSKGNTWTAKTIYGGSQAATKVWYCQAPTVGAGHTFTLSGTNIYVGVSVAAFSGSVASPWDLENGATTAAGTTLATGSITPSQNDELVVAAVGSGGTGTSSINGGFTNAQATAGVSSVSYGVGLAYLIQTTAAAANPTWTISSSTEISAAIESFKTGASGAALAATPAAQATATAALTTQILMAATPGAIATATAALTTQIKLGATPAGQATATGALTTQILLASGAAALATATGALTTAIQLAGAATGLVTMVGGLNAGALLNAGAAAVATLTGALTTAIQLAGSAVGLVTATGNLNAGALLNASAAASASMTGALTTGIALAAVAAGVAAATGALTTAIRLAGSATGSATLTGTLAGAALLADPRFILGGPNRSFTITGASRDFRVTR